MSRSKPTREERILWQQMQNDYESFSDARIKSLYEALEADGCPLAADVAIILLNALDYARYSRNTFIKDICRADERTMEAKTALVAKDAEIATLKARVEELEKALPQPPSPDDQAAHEAHFFTALPCLTTGLLTKCLAQERARRHEVSDAAPSWKPRPDVPGWWSIKFDDGSWCMSFFSQLRIDKWPMSCSRSFGPIPEPEEVSP